MAFEHTSNKLLSHLGCISALALTLLEEASILVKDSTFQGCSSLNETIDLSFTIRLAQLKVDSHVIAAWCNASQESHGVIKDLLLVLTSLLGIDNCSLCV